MIDYNWNTLSSDEFEELCMELMRIENFSVVRRLGGIGPGDEGRDIHAEEYLRSQTGVPIRTTLLVQCKNYFGSRTAITPAQVEAMAIRAQTMGYRRLFIITSYDLSSTAKTKAIEISDNRRLDVRVDWWNRYRLSQLLFVNPAIKRRYQLDVTTSPNLKIGILSGYIDNPEVQSRCHQSFIELEPEDWLDFFSGDDLTVELINLTELNHEFDSIINPFGEIYPEQNPETRSSYGAFLNYIRSGGVFVGSGGFPFFYYYDFSREDHFTSTTPTIDLLDLRSGQRGSFFSFRDVPFSRDFNVTIEDGDTRLLAIRQDEEDTRYVGNLMDLGYSEVSEFRSITDPGESRVIPLLRAEEGSTLPLSAIKLGHGYYIHSGFNTNTREATIIATALLNWLRTAGGNIELT